MKKIIAATALALAVGIAAAPAASATPTDYVDQQIAYRAALSAMRQSGIGYSSALCQGWRNPYAYGMTRAGIVHRVASGVNAGVSHYDLSVGIRRAFNTRCY